MPSAVTTITDFVLDVIVAKTPQVNPHWAFHPWGGKHDDDGGPVDNNRERMVRVEMAAKPVTTKLYGLTSRELEDVLVVTTTHVLHEDLGSAFDRMDADREDIMTAVLAQGLNWPAALVNIRPTDTAAAREQVGDKSNLYLQAIPFLLTYQVN